MSKCESCGVPLLPRELFRKIELEDGTEVEIQDNFCNRCLEHYVYRVDDLDYREYAFEHLTENVLFENTSFTTYKEE
jgi:hypothetical protein